MGTHLPQGFHELEEGRRVEFALFPLIQKLTVPKSHGSEVTNVPPRWVMQQYGILLLRRNPHPAPGSMLLEVNLIHGP
jgi:hypothetical protein